MFRKFSNVWRGLNQKYASATTKGKMWDREYTSGKWDNLRHTIQPELYRLISSYACRGKILDIGCGPGATANEMPEDSYTAYLGIDVSGEAVREGAERSRFNGRVHCEFVQADIVNYFPTDRFDLILFRESIYYLADPLTILQRLARDNLAPTGKFVVVMPKTRYQGIIHDITQHFAVVASQEPPLRDSIVLVFTIGQRQS
jgi:SAM-dependent methyltransferase